MTSEIDLQEQLNSDGSLSYLKYKYKGSIVKLSFGYDTNGKLNKILIPSFLNLKPQSIFDIVTRQFLERINRIETINLINRIALIDAITKIDAITEIGTITNPVDNNPEPTSAETYDYSGGSDLTAGVTVIQKFGAGFCEYLLMRVGAVAGSHNVEIRIYCDGVAVLIFSFADLNAFALTSSTPKISMLTYTADGACSVMFSIKFEFKTVFSVVMQGACAPAREVSAILNLLS